MNKKFTYLLLVALCSCINLFSQQEGETKPSEAKPLELPNYVIEGKGQINVQSGVKQFPDKLNKLTQFELDSINSLKKEQTVLLPTKPLPSSYLNIIRKKGFASAEFGSFITPSLLGNYEFSVGDYIFAVNGHFEASGEDAPNSDYIKASASLMTEYLAPDKFFIFGGSKTESSLGFDFAKYNLYASNTPLARSTFISNLAVKSSGNYSNSDFLTSASYQLFSVNTGSDSKINHQLSANLGINGRWDENAVGAAADLDFNSYDGNWMHFIQLAANGKMKFSKLDLGIKAGVQLANGSSSADLFDFIIDVDGRYLINHDFTIKGRLLHGMENNNMPALFSINSYLSDSATIDFGRINQFLAVLNYHPDEKFSVSFGAKASYCTNSPMFVNNDTSTFTMIYKDKFLFSILSEGIFRLAKSEQITYNLQLKISKTESKNVTYEPMIALSSNYRHYWIPDFSSSVGVTYIGSRYADVDNNIELPEYFDLQFMSDYRIQKNWTVFIKVNNILNQNIYIWNGCRERGLFISGGINLIF
jgi:outer membrane receptor protein involved in Fe transport